METENIREEAIQLFITTDRMHKQVIDSLVQSTGLSRSTGRILMYLYHHGEMGSQKELAEAFEVSSAAITVSLKKLENLGVVERIVCENDNRNRNIRLTEKGKKAVIRNISLFEKADREMLSVLSDDEIRVFNECNKKMQQCLHTMSNK